MTVVRSILLLVIAAFLSGCASKVDEEITPPPLMIAQNGDGDVTLQWESDPDCLYTIFYQTSPEENWQGLDDVFRLPGTGEIMTAYDRVNPNHPPRRYRILPEKAK